MDKLPKFDELLKNNTIKEKDSKILNNKIVKNFKTKIFSKNRININYNLSNRLKNIISNHEDISLLSKKFIKNIKKISIKKSFIINDKSINHKKIVPINYFQDYKKKNSSRNKNIKKNFTNFKNFVEIKKIKENLKKGKNSNYNISYKHKRPYSKEERTNNMKIKEKKNDKKIKNKILKIVAQKVSLPEKLLIKKINKSKNCDIMNCISKSEIKKRRAKSNNKTKNDISQKIDIEKNENIFHIIKNNYNSEYDIDDVLKNREYDENEEIDNFDDLYSIVRLINFDDVDKNNKKDNVFSIDNNNCYSNYKKKFEKIWKNMYN